MDRPDWDTYFLNIAKEVAKRSHDQETQVGCVIVNKNNHIISTGYNGFCRGMNDANLPAKRPLKYPYCFHSERNALANCEIRPKNCTAYVTQICCKDCLYSLWQHGITEVVMINKQVNSYKEEDEQAKQDLIDQTDIVIRYVNV